MTTTAPFGSNLEAENNDAMDLLSDAGYEMGGDIDLDMGSTNGNQHQEDDALSLQDAGTDGGVEVQPATGHQDDFMIDKDDLIEVDEIDYGDFELGDAGQPSIDKSLDVQDVESEAYNALEPPDNTQPIADDIEDPEEDIIDYSDDEGQDDDVHQEPISVAKDGPEDYDHEVDSHKEDDLAKGIQETLSQTEREPHQIEPEHVLDEGDEAEVNENAGQPWTDANQPHWHQPDEIAYQETAHIDDDCNADQDLGAPDAEHNNENEQSRQDGQSVKSDPHHKTARQERPQVGTERHVESESKDQSSLHPVTINYDGSELWLFKPRDTEDGDWLLSDDSVATQEFLYLFNACRVQLGGDINDQTEIGFRFDHFHAMELFEDCTACAYTTLKELIDIYLGLHAQDGQTSPEPFYVTLRFRPRVLTLVNELKKAFHDEIGFAGLNSAVASGQTSFNAVYANSHPDSLDEHWEAEEQEMGTVANHEEATIAENVGPSEQQDSIVEHETHSDEEDRESAAVEEQGSHRSNIHDGEDVSKAASAHTGGTDASALGADDDEDFEEDVIDYSDDEGAVNADQAEQTPANERSSSSSTVQGDDASNEHANVENFTNNTEFHDDTHPDYGHGESVEDNAEIQAPTGPGDDDVYAQYQENHEANLTLDHHEQQFDQAYNQVLDDEEGGYYYNDIETSTFGQPDDPDMIREPEDAATSGSREDAEQSADIDYAGVEDFLDLAGDDIEDFANRGTEPEADKEYDNEEGAANPAAAASSSAVAPAVASTVELEDHASPQGQKRPIDEVDGGVHGSSDIADAKRTKL